MSGYCYRFCEFTAFNPIADSIIRKPRATSVSKRYSCCYCCYWRAPPFSTINIYIYITICVRFTEKKSRRHSDSHIVMKRYKSREKKTETTLDITICGVGSKNTYHRKVVTRFVYRFRIVSRKLLAH